MSLCKPTSVDQLVAVLKSARASNIAGLIAKEFLDEFFPGISRLAQCDQGKQMHFEGAVDVHTALVLDRVRALSSLDLKCRFDDVDLFAALMHEIEKPATRTEWPD